MFSKPCLVNLISKDTHLVFSFYAAIYALTGGDDSHSGRLVVFYNGYWGTVCKDKFDDKAAKVVCKQLNKK